jgi:hypothetical protein
MQIPLIALSSPIGRPQDSCKPGHFGVSLHQDAFYSRIRNLTDVFSGFRKQAIMPAILQEHLRSAGPAILSRRASSWLLGGTFFPVGGVFNFSGRDLVRMWPRHRNRMFVD